MTHEKVDRNIPFYNVILKCKAYKNSEIILKSGYRFKNYEPGDENSWAKLEYEIGDFDSVNEAKEYFIDNYCKNQEIRKRCFFVLNSENEIVGSCTAWKDKKDNENVASLHWLVVSSKERNKGLGKALCQKVLNFFHEENKFPVYIHTQPWSYKAILLYINLGFKIQISDTFSSYKNEYGKAMKTLNNILSIEQYEKLKINSEK